jgi:hypothetical protein
MNKFSLYILIGLILVFNVNAEEVLHDAIVTEHHTWTTGEVIKAGLKEDMRIPYASATTSAYAGSAWGHVYQNISLSGSHSYNLTNSGNGTESFTAIMKLCTSRNDCFYDSRSYAVKPGGSIYNSGSSSLTASFSTAGNYGVIAETNITGAYNSNSLSRGDITIQK